MSALSWLRRAGSMLSPASATARLIARERRPQLVRAVGEQHLVRLDQLLDTGGGRVEALGQRRHLVLAFDLHAGGEIAAAKLLDPGLEPLEPAREPARDRPGADRNRKPERVRRVISQAPGRHGPRGEPDDQPPPVLETERQSPRRTGPGSQPEGADALEPQRRHRPPGRSPSGCRPGRTAQVAAQPAVQSHRALPAAPRREASTGGRRRSPVRWRCRRHGRSARPSRADRHSTPTTITKMTRMAMIVR